MNGKRGGIGRTISPRSDAGLVRAIDGKISRRMSKKRDAVSALRAFTLFGIVGWSVAVPVVLGAYIGRWLDRGRGAGLTLSFMAAGFAIGCYDAYYWLSREKRNLDKNDD